MWTRARRVGGIEKKVGKTKSKKEEGEKGQFGERGIGILISRSRPNGKV
jgi:hypothetical protein